MENQEQLREDISQKIDGIFELREQEKKFIPGKTLVRYAGAVYDQAEVKAMIAAILDGWFGLGKQGEKFETGLAEFIGTKGGILTNSGSSASLLATNGLMSTLLPESERLKPGDEIITPACGFPTTINPALILGLVPVFLDVNLETCNINADDLEKALSDKTRAIFLPHTLGNPNEMDKVVEFARAHRLYLVEDNCDALGSEYDGRKTGSFGDLATASFYPAHHITIGEGGMVFYNDEKFVQPIRSLRDWGRACHCRGDEQSSLGACNNRFSFKINNRPCDHKYMYSQIGYNLKPVEFQAAMGVEQLKKLPEFIVRREHNFNRLYEQVKNLEEFFILPKSLPKAKPCWFAFPLTIRAGAPFDRLSIINYLEERLIQTRPLFAGNIIRQPAYQQAKYRIVDELKNSDYILHHTFFVGVYPGLDDAMIDYIADNINGFIKHLSDLKSRV
ncbi:MAG: lipopolysaccharide biosynthesis protein RfbH [Patescibacteria group bacterium]|jgi:CDP-6-deoxy-D-xylo-4-hexulose-3-dehydrase